MKARLVPEHHHMHIGIDFAGKLAEEQIYGGCIEMRGQQPDGLAGRRARRAQDIEIVVASLSDGGRTTAGSSPLTCERALLTEACFVLEPDFETLVGVLRRDLIDQGCGAFLKAATAAGSFFS